jgi:hypothetical protein
MNVFSGFNSTITRVSIPNANGITDIRTDISYTTLLSGSKTYYYFQFTNTINTQKLSFFNISGGNVPLNILAVGGGGGGGGGNRHQYGSGGGGGGAGAVGIGIYNLNTGYDVSLNISIGKGGNRRTAGDNTTIMITKNGNTQSLIAYGGSYGQNQQDGTGNNGINGSSGGGGATARTPGSGSKYNDSILTYYGSNGGSGGVPGNAALFGGGGGGGAGGAGGYGTYPFGSGKKGIGLSVNLPGIPSNTYGGQTFSTYGEGGEGGGGSEGSFASGNGYGGGGGGGGGNTTDNGAPGVQGTVIISINAANVNNIYYTN